MKRPALLWRLAAKIALPLMDWQERRYNRTVAPAKIAGAIVSAAIEEGQATRPRPLPPKYTLWIESDDEFGPDLLATAADLTSAIAKATDYARTLSTLILLLETETGEGWAIQSVHAGESIPATVARR